jgi:DNA-binding transcriptional MocR family regulator
VSKEHYSSEPEPRYLVEEETDERKYFTQIPNFIFALPMSREAKYLYIHLKRTAGDAGECFKSLRTLSKETQTSKPTLIKAKAELVSYGLIRVSPGERKDKADVITIRNVWRRNLDHFDRRVVNERTASRSTPKPRAVNQKTTPGKGEVRKKNTEEEPDKKSLKGKSKNRFEGYEWLVK